MNLSCHVCRVYERELITIRGNHITAGHLQILIWRILPGGRNVNTALFRSPLPVGEVFADIGFCFKDRILGNATF